MPAPTWAAAPVEDAAAMAEVVEAALDSGVEVEEAGMVAMLVELGVGVTELTRSKVFVIVVVEVIVVVLSSATASGASARQREPMMVVNFIVMRIC